MIKVSYILLLYTIILVPTFGQVEICDNGIDDDNDNLIDINDDDCYCQVSTFKSLISNPSFEDLDCCPSDKSQLYCATGWIQASSPTTDFIHQCDWTGLNEYPPPLPFPDGIGILGFRDGRNSSSDPLDAFWKEYAGACLINPMEADSNYRFQFDIGFVNPTVSPPINVSFFGTTSCEYLPFGVGDVAFGCPSNSPNWIKLGEVLISGGSGDKWIKTSIDITPYEDIHAIAIGPDCDPIISDNGTYYFFDNLILTDLTSFDLQLTEIGHPCTQNFTLSIPENTDLDYQWYLSGVALVGEVSSMLTRNYGEGSYQVRISAGSSCRLSDPYEYNIPTYNTSDTNSICKGDLYHFGTSELTTSGTYLETFKTKNNCDSTVTLQLKVIGEKYDTIERTIAPGEILKLGNLSFEKEGEYSITIPSSIGCDSLLYLKLSHFKVFTPNVFSPNHDGVNDFFHPIFDVEEVLSYDIKIYDRWGKLIYQGDSWDGSNLTPDVFLYMIEVEFINGETNTFYGSVTLLK